MSYVSSKNISKSLVVVVASFLVASLFVLFAWANESVDVAEAAEMPASVEPNEGSEGTETVRSAADESGLSVQAVTATEGWELIGTCEWKIEDDVLYIRPAGNGDYDGIIGVLPDTFLWPWARTTISSVDFPKKVVADKSLENFFYACADLASIKNLENLDTRNVTDMSGMFNHCSALTSLNVSNFNTSNVTKMYGMFANCSSLASLNVSNFNTSNVTDMSGMFRGCSSLTSLDVSNYDTSKVMSTFDIYVGGLFEDCSSLKSLDLSNLDTSQMRNMNYMFSGCSSLASLDLSSFNTSELLAMESMFSGCASLTTLNLSSFDTTKIKKAYEEYNQYVFKDCPSLKQISIGSKFTFQSQFPDKTWYNQKGESFTPSTIPLNTAGIYTTTKPSTPGSTPPTIIGGSVNITWAPGSGVTISFRSDAPISIFIEVRIDGKVVAPKNYTVKEGSTIVELKDDYLATLPEGDHSIDIVSGNGTASSTFKTAKSVTSGETTPVENQEMYRLYNPYSGEHLFTKDKNEYETLGSIGWIQEGEAWKAPTTGDPVYRLYNPYSGDHHYTTDKGEYDTLGTIGWIQEDIAWYSGGSQPVYRLFNPYVTVGTHHYTTDKNEYDTLGTIGWIPEDIGWYSL